MIIFLVIAIILIVLVFGVQSIMTSYATAQQAQATIETAKATQTAVFGNVFMIVVVGIFLLAVIALFLYAVVRSQPTSVQPARPAQIPVVQYPALTSADVIAYNLTPEELKAFTDELFDLIEEK